MSGDYQNRTKRFGIPSIAAGQYISETDEERAAQIIETQMLGSIAAHSGGHGLFNQGMFSVTGDSGGFVVTLVPSGGFAAAEGFIRLIYFRITEVIQWAFEGDGVHKLYLQLVEDNQGSSRQFGDVIVDSTMDGDIPDDALLIAEATVSGSVAIVDEAPADRLDISKLDEHIADSTNPHTTLLSQDQMVISGLTVEQLTTQTLEVKGELRLSGTAIFQQDVTLEQDLIINGDLVVSGNSVFNGPSQFDGAALFDQIVASDITILSGLDILTTARFFNHIEVSSGVTIDGRDVGQDGLVLDDHISGIAAFLNPHNVTAAQVSGIPITGSAFGGPTLSGNLNLLSGISIDGIDPSTLIPLIDGSNADGLHTHDFSGIPDKFLSFSPEYGDAVLSGAGTVVVDVLYDVAGDFTTYRTTPTGLNTNKFAIIKRVGVPADFKSWPDSGITVFNGVTDTASAETYVTLRVIDTTGSEISLDNAEFLRNPVLTSTTVVTTPLNAGTFVAGELFTTILEMSTVSGVSVSGGISKAQVGDLIFGYETLFKP